MRVLALLLLLGVVLAADPTIVEQADRVLAAVDDAAKLKELADAQQPAHWSVADELSSRGEHAAAVAYARASSRKDRDELVAYLKARRAKPTPRGTWARLGPLWRAVFSAPKVIPEQVAPFEKLPGYPGAYARVTRGVALLRNGNPKVAEPPLREAFRRLHALGCRDDSAWALYWISSVEQLTGRVEAAERGVRRMIALEPAVHWRMGAQEMLAALLVRRGAFAEAERLYQEVLQCDPDRSAAWLGLGHAAGRRGDYEEALRRYRRARAAMEKTGEHHNVPVALDGMMHVHGLRGDTAEAISLARESLALSRKLGNVSGVAAGECSLARMLLNAGEYKQAAPLVLSALAAYERLNAPAGVAHASTVLGAIRRDSGDLVQARDAFRRSLKLYRGLRDAQETAGALANLGAVEAGMGRIADAIVHLREAHSLVRSLDARDQEVRILTALGNTLAEGAEFDQAVACCQEVLDYARERENRPLEVQALQGLGHVHRLRGDFDAALAVFRDAGAKADRVQRGQVLLAIGAVHDAKGDLTAARACFEQALALVHELGQRAKMLQALNGLASVDLALGSARRARARYEEALRLAKAAGDRRGEARVLANIGETYDQAGELARALRYHEQARALQEKTGDRVGLVTTLRNLGGIDRRLGQRERGEKHLRRSVALAQKLGLRREEASALGDLANFLRDPDEAEAAYRRALALYRRLGDRRAESNALLNLATVCFKRGDYEDAIEHIETARDMRDGDDLYFAAALELNLGTVLWGAGRIDEAIAASLRGLRHAKAVGAVDKEAAIHGNLITLYGLADRPREAMASVRRALELLPVTVSGLAAHEGASARDRWAWLLENALRTAGRLDDPREASFVVESVRAGALLEALGGRGAVADIVVPEALRNEELRARAAVKKAEGALAAARRAKRRKLIRAARTDLDAERGKLMEVIARIQREARDGASVAYPKPDSLEAIQRRLGEEEALVTLVPVKSGALVFVTTRDGARSMEVFGERADLTLHDPKRDYAAALAKMRSLVRLLQLGPKIRRVLISPAGSYAYLPFALIMPDKEVAYVPSGTVLGLLRESKRAGSDAILALGDPDYAGTGLAPLPATRVEARAIGTKTLLGAAATKDALEAALRDRKWRAVHLACHGLVDRERPLLSELALTGGKLRVLDVFRTRMHADLVVLSACETGRGKAYRAEGVLGFTRAFLFAGTPRVIVSLWKVDDEATRALMVKFYELWSPSAKATEDKKGLPTATALKRAQAFVRSHEKWKHPYYWAAWQLWGLPE